MPGVVNISEAATIAIHAMVIVAAHPDRTLPAKEIAAAFHLSNAHLAKVMQRLVKAGLVTSTRGPSGGFTLSKPSGEITLLEIFETIEGPYNDQGCLLGRDVCLGRQCILGDAIYRVNAEMRESLGGKTLDDLTASYVSRHA
jgi:Rrf2 family protein